MDTGWGGEGEGEIHGGSTLDAYTLTYVIDSQWEFSI